MTSFGAVKNGDDADSDFGTINNLDWLDTWLHARGDALKGLVQTSVSGVAFHQLRTTGRKRKRQPKAQDFFVASVETVVCNLVRNILAPDAKDFIGYDRTKMKRKSRYIHPFYSVDTLVKVVDWMEEYGAVDNCIGHTSMASFIAPTEWFRSIVGQHGILLSDIGRSNIEEVICLNRNTKNFAQEAKVTEHVEYEDNIETIAFREELRSLNTYLEAADISFVDDGWGYVDVTTRRLKRYFSLLENQAPRFDQHGRLFGGFWINLKSYRRVNIRVQGEPCADLDFASMFVSLAYAEAGLPLPEGDLYDLSDTLKGYVGDKHRSAVKTTFNTALFGYANTRLPKGVKAWSEAAELDAKSRRLRVKWLPPNTTLNDLSDAFRRKHPAISDVWGTQRGFGFFLLESRIILKTLFRLKEVNVVGLPCHDGLLVPASKAETAKTIMEEISAEVLGIKLNVKRKPFPSYPLLDTSGCLYSTTT